MEKLYQLIKRTNTIPRGFIFIFDLFICAFSIVYANLLRFNFDFSQLMPNHIYLQVAAVTLINAIFFKIFHTYEGVIRLSSVNEGFRCVSAIFYSFFIISVCNIICSVFNWLNLVPTTVTIIYFFLASFLIFGYRIITKNLYRKSLMKNGNVENVLIAGGSIHGSLIIKAMEQISSVCQYNVVGFIEENKSLIGKKIEDVKVFSFEQIISNPRMNEVKLIFFAEGNIGVELKSNIVDYCLAHNIPIKVIPPVQKWIQGQLNLNQLKDIKIEDLLNRPTIELATEHVRTFIKKKRVLVTGAAGSIGSEIAKQVASLGPELLILFDQNESGLYEVEYNIDKQYGERTNLKIYIGDIRDKKTLKHLFSSYKPEVVFHAAAYKHVPMMESNPSEAILNNVLGTKLLADLSKSYEVDRFVFISTDKAINPTNVMGASKRISEMYIQSLQNYEREFIVDAEGNFRIHFEVPSDLKHHTKFIITRFGNVLGSNGSVIPRFKEQINSGGPITVTHPDIIRYFMTIPEACSLVLEAGTMGKGGEIFIFDMGDPVKIVDLAQKMIKLSGLALDNDIKIKFTGLRPGEKLFEELLNKKEEVIPTHHKKIMIAKASYLEFESLSVNVNLLIKLAQEHHKDFQVVKQMKVIIPEYKSKNSDFEVLDNDFVKKDLLHTN